MLQQLTVLQGDIAKVKCDAVIHPTNASCSLAGLVGKHLLDEYTGVAISWNGTGTGMEWNTATGIINISCPCD